MMFDAVIPPDHQYKCRSGVLILFVALACFASTLSSPAAIPSDGVVNVTLPPYSARPGKGVDNTPAIQRAITDNVGTRRILFFPAGTYEISDTLVAKNGAGIWTPFLTLEGENRIRVVLRLSDNSKGFNDKNQPKSMIMTGSLQEKGDSVDGGGNKAFGNTISNLTLDTGSGNPGAIGIDYAVSNQGAIENVDIRSGDGSGVAGISMLRRVPGPGLIKNVTVTNFDVGIDIGDMEYGMTLENVTLNEQKLVGIRDTENLLYVRRLQSENTVPAVQVTRPNGSLVMLESVLTGGAPDQYAIDCQRNLVLRNVVIHGYREKPIRCDGKDIKEAKALITQPGTLGAMPTPLEASLGLLPIQETPQYIPIDDRPNWTMVGPRLAGENDDTAAIQRAIDSGKSVVCFPNDRTYFLSDTVVVRGAVQEIRGMGSEISLGAAKIPFGDVEHLRPLIRIDPTSTKTVFFEGLFFNAQYPGEILFENNTTSTIVIRHCMGWVGSGGHRHSYRNTAQATGKVFIEDVFLPGWEFRRQTVWARQFNPENPDGDGVEPQVSNIGGKLWILGFKTEGPAPFLATTEGGTTELLGAYNYISATNAPQVPADAVPYIVANSTAALTFLTDNFRDNDYHLYIRETQGDHVREWKGSDLSPRDGSGHDRSFFAPLYRSQNSTPP